MVSKNIELNSRPWLKWKVGAKLKHSEFQILFRKTVEISINLKCIKKIWSMDVKNVRETT